MKFFDYIKIALKNVTRQKARTILTVIAITVGSLSLILMLSIIISIRQSLIDQFRQLGAFNLVTVTKDPNSTDNGSLVSSNGDPSEGKKMDDTTLNQMRNMSHIEEATATIQANIQTVKLEGGTKKTWGNIVGVDPTNNVFKMNVVAGRKLTTGDMDKIVVGQRFLEDIGFSGDPKDIVGKNIVLITKMGGGSAPDWGPPPPKPPENAGKEYWDSLSNQGQEIKAEIVGVVNNGNMDSGGNYIPMDWAKKLMTSVMWQYPEMKEEQKKKDMGPNYQPQMVLQKDSWFEKQGYSAIILKVDDEVNIDKAAEEVKAAGYGANTAKLMLEKINQIFTMISIVLGVIGGISLFVAAIGIINTMIMATYERTREIGVMRACGATKGTILRLFTVEAAMLGFWGGVIGIFISVTLGAIAQFIIKNNSSAAMSNIPIQQIGSFPWWLITTIIIFTTILGMISGLYPAYRAARLDPVESLRYE